MQRRWEVWCLDITSAAGEADWHLCSSYRRARGCSIVCRSIAGIHAGRPSATTSSRGGSSDGLAWLSTAENKPRALLGFGVGKMERARLRETLRGFRISRGQEPRVGTGWRRQGELLGLCATARRLHGVLMSAGWHPATGEHGQSKITPVCMHLCILPSQNTPVLSRTPSPKRQETPRKYSCRNLLDNAATESGTWVSVLGQVKSKRKI